MRLEDFIEQVRKERPPIIEGDDLRDVSPHPWTTRHGSGRDARILMSLGKTVWYERQQGENRWHRLDDASEFDVLRTV
jgi:hypothetical protein